MFKWSAVLALIFVFLSLSASSCDSNIGARSYLNAPANANGTDYVSMAREDAVNAGYPADVFVRQIQWESGFDPNARGGDGEIGIAQFEPSTAAGLGINPYDPVASLYGAAQLMERYYTRYGYDVRKSLSAYNCGGGCVDRAIQYWDWESHIPASTVGYINGIDP